MKYNIKDKLRGKFGKIKEAGQLTPYIIQRNSIWEITNIMKDSYTLTNLQTYKRLYNCSEALIKLNFTKIRKI